MSFLPRTSSIRLLAGLALLLLLATAPALLRADAPAGYYNSAEGKRGNDLRTALRGIISGHNALSYNGAKNQLWANVDNRGGFVQCIYSGRTSTNLNSDTNGMNAEHTWPQSRGAEGTARSDLHHLFVTDATWNSTRGSLRFSNVANPTSTSPIGAKVNGSVGFEPPDEYKGDVARAMFYFHVRYSINLVENPALQGNNGSSSDDPMGILSHLIQWHEGDPVSQFERNRNDRIYAIQNNRNPFIDRPEFVAAMFETGPVAPTVTVTVLPASPRDDESVTFSAQITSSSAINASTVRTFWRVGASGTFTAAPMTLAAGTDTNGTWRATNAVGPQAPGTVIQYYTEATDSQPLTGRAPATGNSQFSFTATAPPVLSVTTDPAQPRFDGPTHLIASVQSERPIVSGGVVAYWRVGSTGAFTPLAMNRTSGSDTSGIWRTATAIPAQPGGTRVEFYVEATNSRSQTTRQPATGQSHYISFEPGAPILTATLEPTAPTAGAPIQIRATITAEGGIDPAQVRAFYTLTPGNGTQEVALTRTSGTNFSGVWSLPSAIDGQPQGTTIGWRVEAQDVLGRQVRFPASGQASATVLEAPRELDIAGWKLFDTDSTNVFTFPAGAVIPANGFVVISRSVERAAFESKWGALPPEVVFFNGSTAGPNGLVINGGEIWLLRDAANLVIDGPTATSAVSGQNGAVVRDALTTNTWTRITDAEATPGRGTFNLTGAGVRITEYGDPSSGFAEAFVEIFYDAGNSPPPASEGQILQYLLHFAPPAPDGYDRNSDGEVNSGDLIHAVNNP